MNAFETAVRSTRKKRSAAIERWITQCLQIIGIDASELKSHDPGYWKQFMAERNLEIEYRYQGISLNSDTEIHQIYNAGEQVGTTLKVKHEMGDKKIILTVSQETPGWDS